MNTFNSFWSQWYGNDDRDQRERKRAANRFASKVDAASLSAFAAAVRQQCAAGKPSGSFMTFMSSGWEHPDTTPAPTVQAPKATPKAVAPESKPSFKPKAPPPLTGPVPSATGTEPYPGARADCALLVGTFNTKNPKSVAVVWPVFCEVIESHDHFGWVLSQVKAMTEQSWAALPTYLKDGLFNAGALREVPVLWAEYNTTMTLPARDVARWEGLTDAQRWAYLGKSPPDRNARKPWDDEFDGMDLFSGV